jgi:hypothetical protein
MKEIVGATPQENAALTKKVRSMRTCSSACPVFDECLLMPLAIKPSVAKDRHCLVNLGSRDLRMAYVNLFLGEQSGLVDEIQRCFISYLKETEDIENEFKKKGKDKAKLTLKDHDRLLVHREKMMAMLIKVHDIRFGQKKGHGEAEKVQKIKLVEIGADGQEVRAVKDTSPLSKTEQAQFEVLEERKMENTRPDPESLVYSQRVKDEILPSMEVLQPDVTTERPAETGKPADHPLLRQFFPE